MMEGGVQQIARTFVNVTTCPQFNNNMIIKKNRVQEKKRSSRVLGQAGAGTDSVWEVLHLRSL
jgi:hypothetical protein